MLLKLKQKILEIFTEAKHKKSPEAEANLILFHSFRRIYPQIQSFQDLVLNDFELTTEVEEEALRIALARLKGRPLQQLLGHQYFLNHEYQVNESVLIPRPETEVLAQQILQRIEQIKGDEPFRFAELGLGSGILSCEIMARFPQATGVATEVNLHSIAIARSNLATIVPEWKSRFQIIEPATLSTGFEAFLAFDRFDFIVSNPPYVSVQDEIEGEVLKHEPHLALFPQVTGEKENPNYFYENFLKHASNLLTPEGMALFEIPHERAESILHEFKTAGFQHSHLLDDLTGRARVLEMIQNTHCVPTAK